MTSIRSATTSDLAEAAATLADAFREYPWTQWSIPEDGYLWRLERLQHRYLAHALEHGIVLVSDDLGGVAALLPPDGPPPTEPVQAEIVELMGGRGEAVFGVELPPRLPESWDFATLGVRQSGSGRGLGSALIREALARVAASPHPRVSLETSSPRNVALYQRHGMTVTAVTEIAQGPSVYTMSVDLDRTEGAPPS